ncbi:MAG: radical SAM protein [Vicinamibacteria bacterium]
MKVVLVSLNIWELNFQPVTLPGLKLFAEKDPLIREQTRIVVKNYPVDDPRALEDLYFEAPDVVAFSCYIWNYERTVELASCLKRLRPACTIVFGGPEVSYTAEKVLADSPGDFVVRGEGEIPFSRLLGTLLAPSDAGLQGVRGIAYRREGRAVLTEPGEMVMDLAAIPSPYLNGAITLTPGEDVMLEGSRGCPYRCNFCDFGKNNPLTRYFPIERVKAEIEHVVRAGVNIIGFTDAVFNMHKPRLREIFSLLARLKDEHPYKLFLEIYADLLNDQDVALFRDLGPVRMEVGLQTISPGAVKDMNRRQNLVKFRRNIQALEKLNNCHVSIDLIYGLPGDNYASFKDSIDFAFSFVGSQVRVYGLAVLKGTEYYNHASKYGLRYEARAPYRVITNYTFSYDDMIRVRKIGNLVRYFTYYEDLVDLNQVVHHVCKGLGIRASDLIEAFAEWLHGKGLSRRNLDGESILAILTEFVEYLCALRGRPELSPICRDLVRYLCYLKRVGHAADHGEAGASAVAGSIDALRPRLSPRALLRDFEFDPVNLLKTEGARLPEVPPSPTCVLLVREQGKVNTFRLSREASLLLRECTGERTVGEIVESYLESRVSPDARTTARRSVESALSTFMKQNIIAA